MDAVKVADLADCVWTALLNPDADASMEEIFEALCICLRHTALHNDISFAEVSEKMVEVWLREEQLEATEEVG